MRRELKFSKKAYIILAITAFFNLAAIVSDQLVIQKEDQIRNYDKFISKRELDIKSFLYIHRAFGELESKVVFGNSYLVRDMNYLVRVINFFNGDLPKKIEPSEVANIIQIYIPRLKKVMQNFYLIKDETNSIYNKIANDLTFKEFVLNNSNSSNLENFYSNIKKIETILSKKTPYKDYIENYNFEAKTTAEQNKNYKVYSDLYTDMYEFDRIKSSFRYLSLEFKRQFRLLFEDYYNVLSEFNEMQNKKNYIILMSILFQILGLVFLIYLFKTLIVEKSAQ